MTEVPEVEILTRDLCEAVVGRTITGAEVLEPAVVKFPPVPEFVITLRERVVLDANRRAKYILLSLSGDLLMAIHFMLWGTLKLTPTLQARAAETLLVVHLDREEDLRLLDKLGYARVALATPEALEERLKIEALGPEVLDPAFNADTLARQLSRRRGILKTVLLNQHVVAGLGNRDADESLWLAGLDPRRTADSLAEEELARLHAAMGKILAEGIALRGTQRDLFGRPGKARHRRYIFERTGLPCPRCGSLVARTRIGGRNTHYCPNCQH